MIPDDIKTTSMQGTLAEVPEIYGGKTPRSTRLLLNEYPNRSFNVHDEAFKATKWQMMTTQMYKGDTVSLNVAREDFEKNVRHQNNPEEMLPVKVYAFRTNCCTFLTVADYCKEANSRIWVAVVFLLAGIGLVVAWIMGVRKMVLKRQ